MILDSINYAQTQNIIFLLLSGLLCFLCFFCKGVQGLFCIITIALYGLIINRKAAIVNIKSFLLFLLPILLCLAVLWLYLPAREMLTANFDDRLKSTFVTDIQNTTANSFGLCGALFMELMAPIAVFFFLLLLTRFQKVKIHILMPKRSLYLLVVGMSASLPLIVTLEQRRFYLITSIPFFALALTGLIALFVRSLRLHQKIGRILQPALSIGIVITMAVAIWNHNTYKRDKTLLEDVHAIGAILSDTTISADSDIMFQYSLVAYLARHYNISLDFYKETGYEFHLAKKQDENNSAYFDGN